MILQQGRHDDVLDVTKSFFGICSKNSSYGNNGDHMLMEKQGKVCVLCSIKVVTIWKYESHLVFVTSLRWYVLVLENLELLSCLEFVLMRSIVIISKHCFQSLYLVFQ